MLDPSGDLSFFGERKKVGSWFSVSMSSNSIEEALRFVGDERVVIAVEREVRFIV